jgi:hypothetical protein
LSWKPPRQWPFRLSGLRRSVALGSIGVMTRSLFFRGLLALALSLLIGPAFAEDAGPVYELRIYTTNEGKLDALLTRFRDHTVALFEKHGIENIGYWLPIAKEDGADNTLIYLLRHKSRDAAKASWAAFGKDPDWQAARKASEENGKILAKPPESIFMTTTDYSPPVAIGKSKEPRVFQLRIYNTPEGKLDALHARFRDHTMELFGKHGMEQIGYWVPTDADKGAGHKLIYLLAHPSQEAGAASFAAFRADPDWIAAKAESEKNGSLTLPQPDGVKGIYMKPTDFSPLR